MKRANEETPEIQPDQSTYPHFGLLYSTHAPIEDSQNLLHETQSDYALLLWRAYSFLLGLPERSTTSSANEFVAASAESTREVSTPAP